jgi:hypothetical protein
MRPHAPPTATPRSHGGEAAWAGTSLITETLSDFSLDADTVEENVDIMANNSSIDDQHADAVCN